MIFFPGFFPSKIQKLRVGHRIHPDPGFFRCSKKRVCLGFDADFFGTMVALFLKRVHCSSPAYRKEAHI